MYIEAIKECLSQTIKCVIVTNLNSMYNLSLNGCEFHYFNTNAKMMSLQQSSIKPCIRFSKNLVYKPFTKGCRSSLSFENSTSHILHIGINKFLSVFSTFIVQFC